MYTLDADRLFETTLQLLRTNPYGFLATVADGQPHTRLVQHLTVDDDATVWIGTSPRSRKISDTVANPLASYAVEDRGSFAYVGLHVRAEVVQDESECAGRWSDGLAGFFPGGPTGVDFVLLRLRPSRIELMNFADRIHPDPIGLVPAVLERTGRSWTAAPATRKP